MSPSTATRTSFRYRAANRDGGIVRGRLVAAGETEAVRRLVDEGLTPIEVDAADAVHFRRGVAKQDLAVAFRNVATLTGSGVPVEKAMAVSEGLVSERLAVALEQARGLIREGTPVSEALGAMPDVFPRAVVGIVQAGERGSTLASACESAAQQLESEAELRSQIRSALAYPALIVIMGLATVAVMSGVVIPRFAVVLDELGAELPTATRLMVSFSNAARESALSMTIALVLGAMGVRVWLRRQSARVLVDRTLLGLPVVGGLRLGFASARTCTALGAMLSNGMPLLAALDVVSSTVGDREIAGRLARARAAVARGLPLTEALTTERALTPVALQLVGVGEASSSLGPMLTRAGQLAATRAQRRLRTLATMIEPVLVIGLGVLVAATAAALLQAVYSVRPV